MSVVQAAPSEHVLLSAHAAAAVHMPQPATVPSSQRVPVLGVHADVLAAVSQIWQEFDPLMAVFA